MLSKHYKFVFVHVSRTGGSSFERMAGVELTSHKITRRLGNTDFKEKHKDFEYYRTKYPYEFNAFFKFTIVRNPFDRLVSRWLWRTEVVKNIDKMSLKDFITDVRGGHYATKFKLSGLSVQESIQQFDYIGRYEDIAKTYDYLSRKLNLPNSVIPHTNKTNHRHYQDYYNEETKQLVREKYKNDLELFNYDF